MYEQPKKKKKHTQKFEGFSKLSGTASGTGSEAADARRRFPAR